MKNFDFYINKTNTNSFNDNYFPSGTDYSKELDNYILADIIDKNSYLYDYYPTSSKPKTKTISLDKCSLKGGIDITTAINFIINNKKSSFPYILGETYTLSDGTPIIFFEDSIQIGFDLYYYNKLNTPTFLSKLTTSLKKKIATIYTDGLKISIYK